MCSTPTMSDARFKSLYKYIAKAKQLEKADPIVCYSLRYYAAQLASQFPNRTSDENKLLSDMIDELESTKSSLGNITQSDRKLHVENFALQIFDRADDSDRSATGATRATATQFHTAYIIMDACKQFGELDTDINDKLKYCMWKATEITKALKEGRQPVKGSVGEEHGNDIIRSISYTSTDQSQSNTNNNNDDTRSIINTNDSSTRDNAAAVAPPATNPFASSSSEAGSSIPPSFSSTSSQQTHSSSSIATPPVHSWTSTNNNNNSFIIPADRLAAQKEGERQIKHAMSAIAFDDVDTCVIKLQNALHCLQPYVKNKNMT